MTSKDVLAMFRNNFEKLLGHIRMVLNNEKHRDKVSRNVFDCIMYQTGNLMRLLTILNME